MKNRYKVGDRVKLNPNMNHSSYVDDVSDDIEYATPFIIGKFSSTRQDRRVSLETTDGCYVYFSYEKYLMEVNDVKV